ncbi:hypothetical protein MVEN_02406900 [Mycena venus]|uniref:F-box domain-containing protein n=1 Tax=Mycena venus TaxID=2733690 RepID=A0A8H6X2G4_9AGAR|nr:hypothetical protein MVEN_02406900 [Mycena venus]
MLSGLVSERASLALHVEACRSVFAPIRRLPVELLAEIFEMGSSELLQLLNSDTPSRELDRVARRDLLELSQVSCYWHKIAIGTPKLWSQIASKISLWGNSSASPNTYISLLASSLTRSGDHPLTIRIGINSHDLEARPVLELLSQHARRWQDVWLWADRDCGQYLASVRGNLPILKNLRLGHDLWDGVDIFEVAPALKSVLIAARTESVQGRIPSLRIPWPQIRTFTFNDLSGMFAATGLLLAQSLCIGAAFRFHLRGHVRDIPPVSPWPRFASDIESLTLQLGLDASPPVQKLALGQIFESLTLPYLQCLTVVPKDENHSAPVWHQGNFSSFALRSSLHNHLTSLQLCVEITDKHLPRVSLITSVAWKT